MKGYKAFYRYKDKLRCRDKLYEIGKTYKENRAVLCETGMHFCKLLIDYFIYYNASHAVICEVEAPDKCVEGGLREFVDKDSKVCTTKLTIIREVPFSEWTRITTSEAKKFNALGHPWHITPESTHMDILRALSRMELFAEENYRSLESRWVEEERKNEET